MIRNTSYSVFFFLLLLLCKFIAVVMEHTSHETAVKRKLSVIKQREDEKT